MRKFIGLYGCYLKVFFKSKMEYRTAWVTGMFANFYCYLITFLTFWVLTCKFQTIAGWNFSQLTVLYGLNLLSYAIAGTMFWGSVLDLENLIIDGTFDRYLLRPVGLLPQMALMEFGYTFLGQIAVALIFLLRALLDLELMQPATLLFALYTLAGSVFLQSGAMIFFGAISFWTMRSQKVADVLYYDMRSLVHYPLEIYPKAIGMFLTFILPWALINYYPSLILLQKPAPEWARLLGFLSPLLGVLIFIGARRFFYCGLRRYESTGS